MDSTTLPLDTGNSTIPFESTSPAPFADTLVPPAEEGVPPPVTPPSLPPASSSPTPPRKPKVWRIVLALVILVIGVALLTPWFIGLMIEWKTQELNAKLQGVHSPIKVLQWTRTQNWTSTQGEVTLQVVNDCAPATEDSGWLLRYRVNHLPGLQGIDAIGWSLEPRSEHAATPLKAHGDVRWQYDQSWHGTVGIDARRFAWMGGHVDAAPVDAEFEWRNGVLQLHARSQQLRWRAAAVSGDSADLLGHDWRAQDVTNHWTMQMEGSNDDPRLQMQMQMEIGKLALAGQQLRQVGWSMGAQKVYWPAAQQLLLAAQGACPDQPSNLKEKVSLQVLLKSGIDVGIDDFHATSDGVKLGNAAGQSAGILAGDVRGQLKLGLLPGSDAAVDLAQRLRMQASLRLVGNLLTPEQRENALHSGLAVPVDGGVELRLQYADGNLVLGNNKADTTYLELGLQTLEQQFQAWLYGQTAAVSALPDAELSNRPPPQAAEEDAPAATAVPAMPAAPVSP